MRQLRPLSPGESPTWQMYNDMVLRINAVTNLRATNGLVASVDHNSALISGDELWLDVQKLKARKTRKSFVRATPGDTSAVEVYLDTDSSSGVTPGTRATVFCEIVGGSALNSAIPRIEDGDLLAVWRDEADSAFRAFFPFQASEDCTT